MKLATAGNTVGCVCVGSFSRSRCQRGCAGRLPESPSGCRDPDIRGRASGRRATPRPSKLPARINTTRPAELLPSLRTANATAISKPTQTATVPLLPSRVAITTRSLQPRPLLPQRTAASGCRSFSDRYDPDDPLANAGPSGGRGNRGHADSDVGPRATSGLDPTPGLRGADFL